LVENKELCEVTMTFQMALVNPEKQRVLPVRDDISGRQDD